ncbi:tRNA-specific adenosine deaminase subunit tad3 [Coemansia sp. RSA 2322]|nr:tRNA-specific adenosine deaminase subunit tad3 [Coemansia sp. RSA 2322]
MADTRVFEIKRVPVEEERQQLVTEQVYTILIRPRQTTAVLQFIEQRLPRLAGIEHVKRVKKHGDGAQLLVIMCQCSQLTRTEFDAALRGTEWGAMEVAVHAVPAVAPYTGEQYERWKTVWPVAYRPLAHVQKTLGLDDQTYIETTLRYVNDMARQRNCGLVVAAVCSPKTRLVLAEASVVAAGEEHPLRHAAMCCIAQVADAERKRLEEEESESAQTVVPAKRSHSLVSVESKCDLNGGDLNGGGGAVVAAGYLCEGLDVFSTKEPCAMCAMALVHSRIGRLFYIKTQEDTSSNGGGISRYSMHSLKALNHHFAAYECILKKKK